MPAQSSFEYTSRATNKKEGILLTELSSESQLQPVLWSNPSLSAQDSQVEYERKQKLMQSVDNINGRFGRDTV